MSENKFRNQVISACLANNISEAALKEINQFSEELYGKRLFGELALPELIIMKGKDSEGQSALKSVDFQGQSAPKVSFIVPTHNRINLLPKCIEGILGQTYSNIEIIIIDDCSTDNTEEYIRENYVANEKVVYVRNEKNLGPGETRQKGYNVSSGEFIVFADDDDFYFEPSFVQNAVRAFMEHDNVGLVCANSLIYDVVGKQLSFYPLTYCGELAGEEFFAGFRTKYRKPNSTFPAVFRRSVLDKADFKNMQMMNDTSIYLRAACYGDVYMLNICVGCYLVHDSNISKSLPHKFILENLDEKKNIYLIAREQFKKELEKWYVAQLMDTIKYYLESEKISFIKFSSILKWLMLNGGSAKKELIITTCGIQKNRLCKH